MKNTKNMNENFGARHKQTNTLLKELKNKNKCDGNVEQTIYWKPQADKSGQNKLKTKIEMKSRKIEI